MNTATPSLRLRLGGGALFVLVAALIAFRGDTRVGTDLGTTKMATPSRARVPALSASHAATLAQDQTIQHRPAIARGLRSGFISMGMVWRSVQGRAGPRLPVPALQHSMRIARHSQADALGESRVEVLAGRGRAPLRYATMQRPLLSGYNSRRPDTPPTAARNSTGGVHVGYDIYCPYAPTGFV